MANLEELLSNLSNLSKEIVEFFQTHDVIVSPKGEPEVPLSEFEILKQLLESNKWPPAVSEDNICNKNNENDKKERGVNIAEWYFSDFKDKKILDFGCGEGHVVIGAGGIGAKAFGYDIVQSGNLKWDNLENNTLLTTNFESIQANAPYDCILIYDVLDHTDNPEEVMGKVKLLSNENTKIIVKCHPWCSRHGTHIYSILNKAFMHIIFTEEELKTLNIEQMKTNIVKFPISTYKMIFDKSGFKIKKDDVDRSFVENFFTTGIPRERILKAWDRQSHEEFPTFQLEQSFLEFELTQ